MSDGAKPTSQDAVIETRFNRTVAELHHQAAAGQAGPAVQRLMELRAFLAVIEEQVAAGTARIRHSCAPDRDLDALSVHELSADVRWVEAVLAARTEQVTAIGDLLCTMPDPAPALHQTTSCTRPPPAARPRIPGPIAVARLRP